MPVDASRALCSHARRYELVKQLASHNSSLLTQAASVCHVQRAYNVHVQFERVLNRRTDELLAAAKAHREHLLGVQSRVRDLWRGGRAGAGQQSRAPAAASSREEASLSHYENEAKKEAVSKAQMQTQQVDQSAAEEEGEYATMKDAQEVSRMSQLQADLSAQYELLNRRLVEFEFSARRTQEEVALAYRLYAELYRAAKWTLAAMRRLYAPLAKLTQSPQRFSCFSSSSPVSVLFELIVSSFISFHFTQ